MREAPQESRIQAEIAGGSVVSSHEVACKGLYLRGFELACLDGSLVRLADYRDRSAVVLVLSDERPETERLLREVAQHYEEIREKDAEILAIVHGSREEADALKRTLHLPYPVLLDEDGGLHHELGATSAQNRDAAAVCITDRFGEIFALFRTAEGAGLPELREILRNLEFISFQCPECEPPEWPA
jgi:peroxiredoxin